MCYMILVTMSSSAWRERVRVSHGAPGRSDGLAESSGFTHLHVFQAVLLADTSEHVLLAALLHLTRQQKLVEDEVCLLEVEDDVELADVAVVLVHLLDVAMDNLEGDQLIVGGVAAGDEEE